MRPGHAVFMRPLESRRGDVLVAAVCFETCAFRPRRHDLLFTHSHLRSLRDAVAVIERSREVVASARNSPQPA